MQYRPEIDGLRALAVIPVIFFHGGFEIFRGGFVGVDIFFVISGYLITSIILSDLKNNNFSIINFYERRARRILPALFLISFVSLIFGYFFLLPDEFKNLGQSFVSTFLFANNILLAMTSGYWDLDSEFKPLLHTWSLGVEEQYYAIVPILFLISLKLGRLGIVIVIWAIFLLSFIFANWFIYISPDWAFYILPTRAWEICLGALVAFYFKNRSFKNLNYKFANFLSFLGLVLILFSIFTFDKYIINPGWPLLIPTFGTVLIILFGNINSIVNRMLRNRILVFLGLISYSLYLWHQPFFAYLRAYSLNEPNYQNYLYLLPFIFVISFFTWKYIETPFRNKNVISSKFIFIFSISLSLIFIIIGIFINKNYGMPSRIFSDEINKNDIDKRIYNQRVYSYKKDNFLKKSSTTILIVGNSFARDFVNITLENFNISNTEIIYRDDLKECILQMSNEEKFRLYNDAEVIVFASGDYKQECYTEDISFAKSRGKKIFYIGTKDFGYNLNWLIKLKENNRSNKYNSISLKTINLDKKMAHLIPPENYISIMKPTVVKGKIPITDAYGRILSTDRRHLTKYGAIYFGQKAIVSSLYADIFK